VGAGSEARRSALGEAAASKSSGNTSSLMDHEGSPEGIAGREPGDVIGLAMTIATDRRPLQTPPPPPPGIVHSRPRSR
jgi:hypothetical protein